MTETLFPEDGATDRSAGDDVLEPLSRLEEQLRRSRERLVERGAPATEVAATAPAVPPSGASTEPPTAGRVEPPVAPSPYAALAELTPVSDFTLEPLDAPGRTDAAPVGAAPLPDLPPSLDLTFEIPEIPIVELPDALDSPVLGAAAWSPPAGSDAVPASTTPGDDDDVWQPFPDVAGSDEGGVGASEEVTTSSAGREPAALEQDPLPVPHAASRPPTAVRHADADAALAEAAREVSWLARRVADGLDAVTARLDGFERRIGGLTQRPDEVAEVAAHAAPTAAASDAPPAAAVPADPTALEEWSMALARLVRSDSTALRDEVHRMAEEQGAALAEAHRLIDANGGRIATSVEETIARIDGAVLRLADAIEERLGSAVASLEAAADAMRSEDQEALVRLIDDRMEALARLVRSDNERLSARLEAEIGIGREVLRAAKELQASLASDVASALDQRDRMFRASGSGPR